MLASEIVTVGECGVGCDARLAVREGWWRSLGRAGLVPADIALVASTGQERAVLAHVGHFYRRAGLTAGARFLFPEAVAVLDVGARQVRCMRFETPLRARGYAATPSSECWGSDLVDVFPRSTGLSLPEALPVAAYPGLAARAAELVNALAVDGPLAIVGAMARDAHFLRILARRLSDDRPQAVLVTSSKAVFAGAYGAALLAGRRFRRATRSRASRVELPPLPPPPGRSTLN